MKIMVKCDEQVFLKRFQVAGLLWAAVMLLWGGCDKKDAANEAKSAVLASDHHNAVVGVTATWLGTLVSDLLGEDVGVVSIVPAGNCPGHFDITPAQMTALRGARVTVCFAFQSKLRDDILRFDDKTMAVIVMEECGGLAVPSTYERSAAALAESLKVYFPPKTELLAQRVEAIKKRMAVLAEECRAAAQKGNWTRQRVLVGIHQRDFCEFLGFGSITVFDTQTMENPAALNEFINAAQAAQVTAALANAQEGTQVAQTLARRFAIPLIVLDNFPREGEMFEDFVRRNLQALASALNQEVKETENSMPLSAEAPEIK